MLEALKYTSTSVLNLTAQKLNPSQTYSLQRSVFPGERGLSLHTFQSLEEVVVALPAGYESAVLER